MADILTDPLPPLKPAEKFARLETDTFCVECGYNLHSQAVVRDERLGIFVCRCPECGRFHPAGVGVTATKPWANRLATALLVFWILIILFALFWIVMGLGAIQVVSVEDFSYRKTIAPDGREVTYSSAAGPAYSMVYKGTTQPAKTWRMVYTLEPPDDQRYRRRNQFYEAIALAAGAAALGLVSGLLLVCFFWHWKRKRYVWPMLLPLGCAAFVCIVFYVNDEYQPVLPWAIRTAIGWSMWELAWIGVGTLVGRPIVRTMLRMFIPPRPRQHFAFLWAADGKSMPPAART
jgi:hypothetical protein